MSHATDMLAAYEAAELAILKGQSFTFNGRSVGMADLDKVVAGRKEWQCAVNAEQARANGQSGVGVAFADFSGCQK